MGRITRLFSTRPWPLVCGCVLAAYLLLSIAYSLASPLYEPTDELRHFRYVRHIAVYHSLPVQSDEGPRAQSHHPPLYYTLGALISGWVPIEDPVKQDVYYAPPTNPYWGYQPWAVGADNKNQYLHTPDEDEHVPFRGVTLAVYLVRWMTALMGGGVVWLTYRIGRDLAPDHPALAVGAAALVAFNPQFLYLSGAINNDIPAALCGAAVLWACLRLVRLGPSPRIDVTLGLLYGLALLTKFHLVALFGLIALAYLLAAWPTRDWRALARGLLIVLGVAALLSGWWFWRNYVLYGDPTGMSKVNELWGGRSASENWWAIRQSLPYLWSSLWGRFGYGQVPLPLPIYQGVFALCLLGLVGHLVPRRDRLPRPALLILGSSCLLLVAVVCYYILIQPAGAMGRFLFPVLPAFVILVVWGLSRFFPPRLAWLSGLAPAVLMAALAVYALVGVLVPAFAPPVPLDAVEIERIPNPVAVEFEGVARLLGYRVVPQIVEPGGSVDVTLYWQPLARTEVNFAVFVHLLSDVGAMIAQRDTYPGLGRSPTTMWEPGVVFADTYRVAVPETSYAPDRGYIQVGLYRPGGPRLATPDGRDAVRLVEVEVRPRPGPLPNPLEVNFGDRISLVGYELDRRAVEPGGTIHLTLYWRASAPLEQDYRVFAHVLGVENQVWANSDGPPASGAAPTSGWQPGQMVEDGRVLRVGLTTPPSIYDIEVGVYRPGEGRLPVVAEDGHWLDNRVLLGKIRVKDE